MGPARSPVRRTLVVLVRTTQTNGIVSAQDELQVDPTKLSRDRGDDPPVDWVTDPGEQGDDVDQPPAGTVP